MEDQVAPFDGLQELSDVLFSEPPKKTSSDQLSDHLTHILIAGSSPLKDEEVDFFPAFESDGWSVPTPLDLETQAPHSGTTYNDRRIFFAGTPSAVIRRPATAVLHET